MEFTTEELLEKKEGKQLYGYQAGAIEDIFKRIANHNGNHNLLYQLPTGGGKTVIFSEIARRYINQTGKKVLILTHRIELSRQTSNMLTEFSVVNKVINSEVKSLPDQHQYQCFVAMVETLNNRLQEKAIELERMGLVIIDEAHYNSFRKLFQYFEECTILGVTATPLSSNIKLPMNKNYHELIVGDSIAALIEKGFLSKATTFCFNVSLGALKIGSNGDYTVSSSEKLYADFSMQNKLLKAYEERSKGLKTLIFNSGIRSSENVYETFRKAGYEIRHLDNTNTASERREILDWFKHKPDAILTSVGILTTGFDEPTVESIILNRATRSLTLYHQMIGRGSRVLPNKDNFIVIDLGNNVARFGLWDSWVDWQEIFKLPEFYLENVRSDDEIEKHFKYEMPAEIREKFGKTENVDFDINQEYDCVTKEGLRSKTVLERSVEQHARMCIENSEDMLEARSLARLLGEDIQYRVKRYSYCICKSSDNYIKWLQEDYKENLRLALNRLGVSLMEW